MRKAAFTVDIDRDVNLPERGCYEAVSRSTGNDRSPRFASAAKGLGLLVDLLDDLKVRATFFAEGDTLRAIARSTDIRGLLAGHEVACHGVCHEDLTGEDTGICFTGEQVGAIASESSSIVRDIIGRRPLGFRAPYQHVDEQVLAALQEAGFVYDSSFTRKVENGKIEPFRMPSGLIEVPIASARDGAGKRIVSYLWPMHEGKRQPKDYIEMMESVSEGYLILATHSWHVAETYELGRLSEDAVMASLSQVREVLAGIMDLGVGFQNIGSYIEEMGG